MTDFNLLKTIDRLVLDADEATHQVEHLRRDAIAHTPNDIPEAILQERIAEQIIEHFSRRAMSAAGAASLPGIIPGIGTLMAVTGGAAADLVMTLKYQVDMVKCLAVNFGHDVHTEEGDNLVYLLAGEDMLEEMGLPKDTSVDSRAGVRWVRQTLGRAAKAQIRNMFQRIALRLSRVALGKSIPFGIGFVLAASRRYRSTQQVGRRARDWFMIEREMPVEMAEV